MNERARVSIRMAISSSKKTLAKAETGETSEGTRQPRRTRAVGMELLINAAFSLIHEKNPDDISIREISAVANVHHRFIAEWFGGKAQLLLIVHSRNSQNIKQLATDVESMRNQEVILEMNQQLQLSIWLMRNGITFPTINEAFPSLETAIQLLETNRGLSRQDATRIGSIYGAILLSNITVAPYIADAPSTIEIFDTFTKLLPLNRSTKKK